MKERPILFSSEMVKAILNDTKTITRRAVKKDIVNQFDIDVDETIAAFVEQDTGDSYNPINICPYGNVGDRLWVRETWAVEESLDAKPPRGFSAWPVWFKANNAYCCNANGFPNHGFHNPNATKGKWRPSIFMPRWASRITLEITDIKVEQLQDITEEDAIAEGIHLCAGIDEEGYAHGYHWGPVSDTELLFNSATSAYRKLWDSINGRKPSKAWDDNPWVWVIEFKEVK